METVGTYPTVVAKSGANWGYIFEFLTTTRPVQRYRTSLGKINLYLDKANPSWGNVAETGVQLKEWTHLAATYDGKTIHYYFNGKLDGTYSNIPGGQIAENADNVHIGGRKVGEPHNFNGIIDEVRIYNRALIKAESACSLPREAEVNLNLNSDGTAVNLGGKVATTWGNLKGSRQLKKIATHFL